MQEQGEISKSNNLMINTLFNIVFWFYPIIKYRDNGSDEHNKLASKVNHALFGLLVVFIFINLINTAFY